MPAPTLPSTLSEAATANARILLARVIWSFRRTGNPAAARSVIRNARLLGTYPTAPASRWARAAL